VLALGAISFSVLARTAHASGIFDFSGACSVRCTGTATGVLTLTDAYVFGTDITTADFVSFSYSSSDTSFTITSANIGTSLPGGLNTDGSFNAGDQVGFQGKAGTPTFESTTGEFVGIPPGGNSQNADVGFSFTFKLVSSPAAAPEPQAILLVSTGVFPLVYYVRRKRREERNTN